MALRVNVPFRCVQISLDIVLRFVFGNQSICSQQHDESAFVQQVPIRVPLPCWRLHWFSMIHKAVSSMEKGGRGERGEGGEGD